MAILLTYGPNRDWLKNIVATHGQLKREGKSRLAVARLGWGQSGVLHLHARCLTYGAIPPR